MANFDGYSVDTYKGRFAGTFDVETADGETYLRYGNKVILLVVGTVGPATMGEDSLGDMKRTNRVNVEAVRFVSAEEQSDVLAELGIPHQLTIPTTPSPRGLVAPGAPDDGARTVAPDSIITPDGFHIDAENGEILGEVESEPEPEYLPEPAQEGKVGRIPPPKDKYLSRFLSETPA